MPHRTLLFVGSYTHGSPIGISVFDASDPQGPPECLSQVDNIEHASYLTVHPNKQNLYAVSEMADADAAAVVAFRIDPDDGSLGEIDRVPSGGSGPCYVSLDAQGRFLYVANYLSGTIAVLAIEADGRFGQVLATHKRTGSGPTKRQESSHPHCIVPGPSGETVYLADLGTDAIAHLSAYPDPRLVLEHDLQMAAGCGPRHLTFHPGEPVAFLICELDSTLVAFEIHPATGRLDAYDKQSTLPTDFTGESIGAEVRVHPNGRYVYASNRGHDSIAAFRFDGLAAPLKLLGHAHSGGKTPRNFALHPSGRLLLVANQESDVIVPFEIDPTDGIPRQLDGAYDVSQPVHLTFVKM